MQAEGKRLLVDPSPYPDELAAMLFARTGLHPGDVDAVFITHFHADHRFGLALFEDAEWLMAADGLAEWKGQNLRDARLFERFSPAEGRLPPGVRLYPSPGHAVGHTSLLVDTVWGPLIVAGDAVMSEDFFRTEEGFRNSVDFERARETIRTIKRSANLVIPGHDNVILNLNR